MLDTQSFRQIMGRFATGITVISLFDPLRQPVGITVNSFTSVSLAPPLILFCLDRQAHIFSIFQAASHFAVNILAASQQGISQHFADYRHHPQPPDLWAEPAAPAPLLKDTLGWMVCRKSAAHDGGDHRIFIGEVLDLHRNDVQSDPLLYFRSQYRRLDAT